MSAVRNFSRSAARAAWVSSGGSVVRADSELAHEEVGHLVAGLVDGGRDDVGGLLPGELDDVLPEVGLDHLDPGRLERRVQPDLLGHHGLALDDPAHAGAARHRKAVVHGVLRGRGEEHVPAPGADALREGLQQDVQVIDRPLPDPVGLQPQLRAFRETAVGLGRPAAEAVLQKGERLAEHRVGDPAAGFFGVAFSADVGHRAQGPGAECSGFRNMVLSQLVLCSQCARTCARGPVRPRTEARANGKTGGRENATGLTAVRVFRRCATSSASAHGGRRRPRC